MLDGGQGRALVIGYFDPLMAGHARRLKQIRSKYQQLIVFIEDPEDAVLPLRARAEMVAALAAVDYVIDPFRQAFAIVHAHLVFDERERDSEIRDRLVERVHERNSAGCTPRNG